MSGTVPSHVSDDLVVDFDCFDIPGVDDDVQVAWLRAVKAPGKDVFWTPRNGGHWVLTRPDDIERAYADHEHFSNRNYMIPRTERRFRPLPLGVDPPDHRKYRALIAPAFSPKAVRELASKARAAAIELIEDLAPLGECDFVTDFAKVLPIVVFLGLAGLPVEERPTALPLAERFIRAATVEERTEAANQTARYLHQWIERRRAEPQDDLISRIVNSTIDGRPISTEETFGLLILLFNGGLDTVAAMLAFAFRHLAHHPEQRHELAANPALIPVAVEELLRRHGIIAQAREVNEDLELGGARLKTGDMVQLPTMVYGLSAETVEHPLDVDFHRPTPIPHTTFGNGVHKCPGANLARQELQIVLEEWLPRIPDFEVAPGTTSRPATGAVSVIRSLPLVWCTTT